MRESTRRQHLARFSTAMVGMATAKLIGGTTRPARGSSPAVLRRRGIESKRFKDSDGREIRQLTDNRLASLHSYYDICPFSPDGRYILFSSADPARLRAASVEAMPSADEAQVCILDTKTFMIEVIGEDASYNTHSGAFPMWHPLGNVVYYRRGDGGLCSVDLQTGKRTTFEGISRQLSPDGRSFVGQLNNTDRPDDPDAWGFYTMNLDGSNFRQIISSRRLYEITPNRDEFKWDEMRVGNPKWSPDGKHLLIAMWCYPRPTVKRSLYIAKPDGSEIRWLTYFGHHHSWMPNGKGVLFNDWLTYLPDGGKEDTRIHLVDFDGTNRRVLIDAPIGSHPCMDPTCTMIADFDNQGIYVVHIERRKFQRIARYRKPFEISGRGTHPHCVWNPKVPQVVYNSAETGHSEVYLATVTA